MGGLMDSLSGIEKHPLLNVSALLFFAGVFSWYLTRLDKETRTQVESRRHLWEATSTYEIEFKKYKSRIRLSCSILTVIFLIAAVVCAIPLFR